MSSARTNAIMIKEEPDLSSSSNTQVKNVNNANDNDDHLLFVDIPIANTALVAKFPPGCRVLHSKRDTTETILAEFATIESLAIHLPTRDTAYKFSSQLSSSQYHPEADLSFAPQTPVWFAQERRCREAVILSALPVHESSVVYSVVEKTDNVIRHAIPEECICYRSKEATSPPAAFLDLCLKYDAPKEVNNKSRGDVDDIPATLSNDSSTSNTIDTPRRVSRVVTSSSSARHHQQEEAPRKRSTFAEQNNTGEPETEEEDCPSAPNESAADQEDEEEDSCSYMSLEFRQHQHSESHHNLRSVPLKKLSKQLENVDQQQPHQQQQQQQQNQQQEEDDHSMHQGLEDRHQITQPITDQVPRKRVRNSDQTLKDTGQLIDSFEIPRKRGSTREYDGSSGNAPNIEEDEEEARELSAYQRPTDRPHYKRDTEADGTQYAAEAVESSAEQEARHLDQRMEVSRERYEKNLMLMRMKVSKEHEYETCVTVPEWAGLKYVTEQVALFRKKCKAFIKMSKALMYPSDNRGELKIHVSGKTDEVQSVLPILHRLVAESVGPNGRTLMMYDLTFLNVQSGATVQGEFAFNSVPPHYNQKKWIGIIDLPSLASRYDGAFLQHLKNEYRVIIIVILNTNSNIKPHILLASANFFKLAAAKERVLNDLDRLIYN